MSLQEFERISVKEGYCYLVDMNPPRRSKPGKVRPVIVVQSQDTLLAGSPGVVVVPLTTNLLKENVLRVLVEKTTIPSLDKASNVLLDQLHTIDRSLFLKELGVVPLLLMRKIRQGIQFLLNL